MADTSVSVTKEKFDALSQELHELKTARRREVADNLEYAKSLGDLSENAEYHEARSAQAELEDRISKLEHLLKNASLTKARHSSDAVGIGSQVRLRRVKDDKETQYRIVGSEEGDLAAGDLSVDSPLARALSGKKVGDSFSVKAPSGDTAYLILAVE